MKVKYSTEELAGLIEPHLAHQTLDYVFGGNASAIRAVNTVLNRASEHTELRRADLILSAMGRPDYLQLMSPVT